MNLSGENVMFGDGLLIYEAELCPCFGIGLRPFLLKAFFLIFAKFD
jgi:hypothetical protein